MALDKKHIEKFKRMIDAAENREIVLVETQETATGEYQSVICIAEFCDDCGTSHVEPVAIMLGDKDKGRFVSPADMGGSEIISVVSAGNTKH